MYYIKVLDIFKAGYTNNIVLSYKSIVNIINYKDFL